MSLALMVDVDGSDVASRLVATMGLVMTASLLLAAWEQSLDDSAGGRWWLPLGCALACAAWSGLRYRRSGRRRLLRLQVSAAGLLRLSSPAGSEPVAVQVLGAWGLGGLICLRIRAGTKVDPVASAANDRQSASGSSSTDHVLLLGRRRFDEDQWRALRRWLVWNRRSRGGGSDVA